MARIYPRVFAVKNPKAIEDCGHAGDFGRGRKIRLVQFFLGERMTAAFFSAAAVVIAGVLLAQWRATDAAEEALLESPAKT